MTILFFEEFPGSSSLSWVAVRAYPVVFKTAPCGGKETLVVCLKDGRVYEYDKMKTGDLSAREVFDTLKSVKMSPKMGTQKDPGTYFTSIQSQLRLYKSNGRFSSFDKFHASLCGKKWKVDVFALPKLEHWLLGW